MGSSVPPSRPRRATPFIQSACGWKAQDGHRRSTVRGGRDAFALARRGDLLPHGFEERGDTLARRRRNLVQRNPEPIEMRLQRARGAPGSSSASILFAAARTGFSARRSPDGVAPGKQLELPHDDVVVFDRIASARRRHVDEVHEHLGPLEMAEEPVAQPVSRMRAFDQARARRRRRTIVRPTARRRRGWARAW